MGNAMIYIRENVAIDIMFNMYIKWELCNFYKRSNNFYGNIYIKIFRVKFLCLYFIYIIVFVCRCRKSVCQFLYKHFITLRVGVGFYKCCTSTRLCHCVAKLMKLFTCLHMLDFVLFTRLYLNLFGVKSKLLSTIHYVFRSSIWNM